MVPRSGDASEIRAQALQMTMGGLRKIAAKSRRDAAALVEVAGTEAVRRARWARRVQPADLEDLVEELTEKYLEGKATWHARAKKDRSLVARVTVVLWNHWRHELRRREGTKVTDPDLLAARNWDEDEERASVGAPGAGRSADTPIEERAPERGCVVPRLPRPVVAAMGPQRKRIYALARTHHTRAQIAKRLRWTPQAVKAELIRIRNLARRKPLG